MADELTASIEDYLVGLASSLQSAQRQLSELTVPGDASRPTVTYQLPKLDFELKLSLELTQDGTGGPAGASSASGLALRGRLLPATGSRSQTAESASIIKGSFLAVPVSGGKPPPVLTTELSRIDEAQLSIAVTLTTAAGEPLPNVAVQFNTDRELGRTLNPGLEPPTSKPLHAVVTTDATGRAVNVMDASAEQPDTRVPVTIDALGRTTTVVFKVESDDDGSGGTGG